jgi:hypothetical protein
MSADLGPPAAASSRRAERGIAAAAVIFLLLPLLFFSSPEYREAGFLVFGIVALALGGWMPAFRTALGDRRVQAVVACLLVAEASSLAGGLRHGESAGQVLKLALAGMAGVLGTGVIVLLLLQPRWQARGAWVALALTVMLLAASLAGYFVSYAWHLELSEKSPHFNPERISVVWPTRMLGGWMGQQFWDHTNTAAYLFAVAWAVLVERLLHRPRFEKAGWTLALLLGVAIFLTASRSGWLMIALVLPFLLAGRGWQASLRVFAVLALAVGLGAAGLNLKLHLVAPPPAVATDRAAPDLVGTFHVRGMVGRGSSGRLDAYRILWKELEGDRLLGHGLAANRRPVGIQLHEHSSYLATWRAGGWVALAAHLAVLGIALQAGLDLARRGCRWPLVLAVAVFAGLLFDRSTVFRSNGSDEFLTHWLAVWIPVLARFSGAACSDAETRSGRSGSTPVA